VTGNQEVAQLTASRADTHADDHQLHHEMRLDSMHGPLSTARNLCCQPVTRKRTTFG
jgi:hypothetical protein